MAATGAVGRKVETSRAVEPDSVNATISLQPSSSATVLATRASERATTVAEPPTKRVGGRKLPYSSV